MYVPTQGRIEIEKPGVGGPSKSQIESSKQSGDCALQKIISEEIGLQVIAKLFSYKSVCRVAPGFVCVCYETKAGNYLVTVTDRFVS